MPGPFDATSNLLFNPSDAELEAAYNAKGRQRTTKIVSMGIEVHEAAFQALKPENEDRTAVYESEHGLLIAVFDGKLVSPHVPRLPEPMHFFPK